MAAIQGTCRRLPDFILGGATKSGTTTLWTWLSRHPEIGLAEGKEPRFFTRETGLFDGGAPEAPLRSGRYAEGFGWYRSLFDHCSDRKAVGEASSRYLHASDAARLIHDSLPDVRLVFVLRDPVERMYAHYRHELRSLDDLPGFAELVRRRHPRFRRYLEDSCYATQLARFDARFSADRILILLTDDIADRPAETAARLFRFLRVDSTVAVPGLREVHNPGARSVSRCLNRLLTARPHARLKRALPKPVGRLLSGARRLLVGLTTVRDRPTPLPQSLREQLQDELIGEIRRTETRLDRDLSGWLQPLARLRPARQLRGIQRQPRMPVSVASRMRMSSQSERLST